MPESRIDDSQMKELRTFLRLTQKQMSSVLSCSVHSLLSLELGRMKLSSRMALKVVRATGISLDWLTGDSCEMLNELWLALHPEGVRGIVVGR